MDPKARLKCFYENVTSKHLIDEVPNYIAEDCMLRMGETVLPIGISGMQQHLIDVRKTYPDLRMQIIRQYCDGEYVISEFIAEATHGGEWLGMKPSGKKLVFTGVNIDRVVAGKIMEHGGAMNTFEPLFEAGIIQPAP